jgi:hypothetical protein
LAVALARAKDMSKSMSALEAARRLEPNNSIFQANLNCLKQGLQGCELSP